MKEIKELTKKKRKIEIVCTKQKYAEMDSGTESKKKKK